MKSAISDVEFVVDQLVTSPAEVDGIKDKLQNVDGVLAIHLNMGIQPILKVILSAGRPTMWFAAPYSGHEGASFGALQEGKVGTRMECLLTSDRRQLAAAIKPFRAIHHLAVLGGERWEKLLAIMLGGQARFRFDARMALPYTSRPMGKLKSRVPTRSAPMPRPLVFCRYWGSSGTSDFAAPIHHWTLRRLLWK